MPIVERGVTYDGTSLVTLVGNQPRIVLRCVRGLDSGPRVRGVDNVIPSAAGRAARNRVNDGRMIELEGFVAGTGSTYADQLADYRAAVETLRALFDPTDAAKTLVVALEDGGTATISARTMPEEPEWGDDSIPIYRALSVSLEAVGADWVIDLAGS